MSRPSCKLWRRIVVIASMQANKTQFDDRTVGQFRLLAAMKATEEFVEVRSPGETGMLSVLFEEWRVVSR